MSRTASNAIYAKVMARKQVEERPPMSKAPVPRRTLSQICAENNGIEVPLPGAAVLGVDPGPVESAWVILSGGQIVQADEQDNEGLLAALHNGWPCNTFPNCTMAIEGMEPYGHPPGVDTFATCVMSGRLLEAAHPSLKAHLITRKPIVRHITGKLAVKGRTNDQRIAEALRLRYGHKGDSRKPGPLKGITEHKMAALAIATVAADRARLQLTAKEKRNEV